MNLYLIGISGKIGSGKDSLARTLNLYFPGYVCHLASPLKGLIFLDHMWALSSKPQLCPFTRKMLQVVGGSGREIDNDIWIKVLLTQIINNIGLHCAEICKDTRMENVDIKHFLFYIPDVRFVNEAKFFKSLNNYGDIVLTGIKNSFIKYCNYFKIEQENIDFFISKFLNNIVFKSYLIKLFKLDNFLYSENNEIIFNDCSETDSETKEFLSLIDDEYEFIVPNISNHVSVREHNILEGVKLFNKLYQLFGLEPLSSIGRSSPKLFISLPISFGIYDIDSRQKELCHLAEKFSFKPILPFLGHDDEIKRFLSYSKKPYNEYTREVWRTNILDKIRACDCGLVYYDRTSVGVTEELIFLSLFNKPIATVIKNYNYVSHPTITTWSNNEIFNDCETALTNLMLKFLF